MTLKLTKQELRTQQTRLTQFQRYLPTLQLKKAMLQFEVMQAMQELNELRTELEKDWESATRFAPLVAEQVSVDLLRYAEVFSVDKYYENIAGVEIPVFRQVFFKDPEYFLFDTPVWFEAAGEKMRDLATAKEKVAIAEEKRHALEKELREVSIRVNLFEKILIPRAEANMKKIRIFLGDQQLSAVAQAKVAKGKLSR